MQPTQTAKLSAQGKKQGCAVFLAYIAWAFWIVIISAADIVFNWETEQVLIEASSSISDTRWLNHLTLSLLLFIPLLVGYLFIRNPRLKSSLQVWMIAAGFALATTPLKTLWVTEQQGVAVLQTLILLLFVGGLLLVGRKHGNEQIKEGDKSSYTGLVIFLVALMILPWILWGAMGSVTDTLVYLILGIAFALFTVVIIHPYLFTRTLSPDREILIGDFLLDGFVIALFFIIILTGLGQNGSQYLQLITLPITGWMITLFAILTRNRKDKGKVLTGLIAAVALIMPVVWFDADELSLLISGSTGGTIAWAQKTAWFSFGPALMILAVNLINFETVKKIRVNKGWNWALSTISVIGLGVTYFLFGCPGFFGDNIFIIMKQQADLTEINKIEEASSRREAVYAALTTTANESQQDIRSMLDKWHLEYTPYYLVNGLESESNPLVTWLIGKRADVAKILENPELRPLPEEEPLLNSSPSEKPEGTPWNLSMIGIDKVQTELGILGEGIVIGQTDSGVDGNNEQLSGSYRGDSGSDDYNWLDPWNGTTFPTDAGGHGTATLGIIVGKDIGIAPEAQWIGCANLARNLGNPAYYLDCMQFMLAPYPQGGDAFTDGDTKQGAMIINNSWGCPKVEGCTADTFSSAVKALETAGIFVSVAAGNTGYYGCSTVTDPLAIYEDVFTAGSVDMDGNVSIFSSIGPVSVDGSGRIKPDILAPGEDIVLAFPGNQYMMASGTSFAAPHVSGVVALMWSANPALIGDVSLTREILEETARPYSGSVPECASTISVPNNVAGYGIIDAYAAVEKAISLK